MNEKAVYTTVPATPGLLIRIKWVKLVEYFFGQIVLFIKQDMTCALFWS